jgi:type IV pilus assembly protein PilM
MSFKQTLKDVLSIKFDKAFGLDIGDRSVEIIELEKIFKFNITTYGRTELPEGVVENGKIIDQNILAEKIKKLLKEVKPKKVSTNKAIVSLPASEIFIKCFTMDSKLKSGSLSKAIVEKMSLEMPFNIDKTYWDYVEKPVSEKGKKMIIFIAVQKDIANSYVKFCNSIGLEVVCLCVQSFSLARTILKSSAKQTLIMDIGSRTTNLSFFDSNDKVNMSISIPVAGDQMTEAVKDGLKIERNVAEDLKTKFGFGDSKENKVLPIISPILEDILKETREAISYYEQTFKQTLDDVYVIGGSALLPGIMETIKKNLKKEVQVGVSNYNVNINSVTSKKNSFPLFANVIGLGMLGASGQFKDFNLLREMPSAEVNVVNKLNLFSMGYLSRVDTIRTILNNKFVLIVMIILIGVIFAVLLQLTKNYGLVSALLNSIC